MSDSKTVCPSGYHHLNDESLSLEEVTSGEEVYRTNAFACYKPYNSTSLEESSAIMCRAEDGVNVNVYGWYVCLQQESTSPWPWLAVLLIVFFALLLGLLCCFLKKRNQEGKEITCPSINDFSDKP